MRRDLRTRIPTLLVAVVIAASACGGGNATRAEFVDHAVEISNASDNPDQEARVREVFNCLWPRIRDNKDLLGRFMDADEIDEDLSAAMSTLLVTCVTGGGTP